MLATWCEELTHLKRPWCWERLRAGKGDDRGWDGWMASLTQCTWVWVDSEEWWWTGRPGMLHFNSVTQSCPTLCNPMNHSMPSLPVHNQLPEPTQTHVHWVGDAIQLSHPLSSLSPALNLSQHQGSFKWGSSSHQVAKVLELQLQHQSWIFIGRTEKTIVSFPKPGKTIVLTIWNFVGKVMPCFLTCCLGFKYLQKV